MGLTNATNHRSYHGDTDQNNGHSNEGWGTLSTETRKKAFSINYWELLLHDGLEVVTEMSVEGVLVERLVEDLVRLPYVPNTRDE